MENPTLRTERLLLRPMTEMDIRFIYKLYKRRETNRYSWYPDLKNRKEAEGMYEKFMKPG